jgi:hypothetical protein
MILLAVFISGVLAGTVITSILVNYYEVQCDEGDDDGI